MEKPTVTAKIQTPTGLKIEVSGSKEEVQQLLETFSTAPRLARKTTVPHTPTASKGKWGSVVEELIADNFFSSERTLGDAVTRLNEKGYNVKGRAIGALARTLSLACRDSTTGLQRRHLSGGEQKGNEQWAFLRKK